MRDPRVTGAGASTAGRGRLVAAALAVVLLLCHGAFGALHEVSRWQAGPPGGDHAVAPAPAEHSMGHSVAVPPVASDGQTGQHGGGLDHANYAAALVMLLFGATALALFFARSSRRSLAVHARLPGRVLAELHLRPSRAPTLVFLQVFRL